jgi:hypothetical protein
MASLKLRTVFGYQAAVHGLNFHDLQVVCPECNDREQAEENRRGAQDCFVGPLPLGFDSQMSADLFECDIDLPATDEPSNDVTGTGIEIGGEEGLSVITLFDGLESTVF